MPPKRESEAKEEKGKKKARLEPRYQDFDFIPDAPEGTGSLPSIGLICVFHPLCRHQDTFFVDSAKVNASSALIRRERRVPYKGTDYVRLERKPGINAKGIEDFSKWLMDREVPTLLQTGTSPGHIMDHFLASYTTAKKLKAPLLRDLLFHQACKVGRQHHLVISSSDIEKAYGETVAEDPLRRFISMIVAYQLRTGQGTAFLGAENDAKKVERNSYDAAHPDFKWDLMVQMSKPNAITNPCENPNEFFVAVDLNVIKKQRKQEQLRRLGSERQGTVDAPLFVDE